MTHDNSTALTKHYSPGNLLALIENALAAIEKTPNTVTVVQNLTF